MALIEDIKSKMQRHEPLPDTLVRDRRIDQNLHFLLHIRRGERARLPRFLSDHIQEARVSFDAISSLLEDFRLALAAVGHRNTKEWFYYVYCYHADPGTPEQRPHQDLPLPAGDTYFTALYYLSEDAKPTEFLVDGYWVILGEDFVMFDGHVVHKGPGVGADEPRRLVLALVAFPQEDMNVNHHHPYRRCDADWPVDLTRE